jgi:hypothetical protein
MDFTPPPLNKSGMNLVCNVNIAYRILKSENFQDNAQKSQPHYMFMNSAWIHNALKLFIANGSLKNLEALDNRAKATRPWKNTPIISIWLCVCISWLNLEEQDVGLGCMYDWRYNLLCVHRSLVVCQCMFTNQPLLISEEKMRHFLKIALINLALFGAFCLNGWSTN